MTRAVEYIKACVLLLNNNVKHYCYDYVFLIIYAITIIWRKFIDVLVPYTFYTKL